VLDFLRTHRRKSVRRSRIRAATECDVTVPSQASEGGLCLLGCNQDLPPERLMKRVSYAKLSGAAPELMLGMQVLMGGGQDAASVTTTAAKAGGFEARFFHKVTLRNQFFRRRNRAETSQSTSNFDKRGGKQTGGKLRACRITPLTG
jgi:hypothetical protein